MAVHQQDGKGWKKTETYTGRSASGRVGEVGKSDQRKSLPKPGAHSPFMADITDIEDRQRCKGVRGIAEGIQYVPLPSGYDRYG